MKNADALKIFEYLRYRLEPTCLPGRCVVAGGVRRGKAESHDLEIVCEPNLALRPRPQFGMNPSQMPKSRLMMELINLEGEVDRHAAFRRGSAARWLYGAPVCGVACGPDRPEER